MLYLIDLILGALIAEFVRYVFTTYVQSKLKKFLPEIHSSLDKKILDLVNAGKESFPYSFTVLQEIHKIDELNKGLMKFIPIQKYVVGLIQRNFDPSVLLNKLQNHET